MSNVNHDLKLLRSNGTDESLPRLPSGQTARLPLLGHPSLPPHITNSGLSPLVPFGELDSRFVPRPPLKGQVHLPKGSDRLSHLATQAAGANAAAAKNLEQILIQQQLQQQLHTHQQLAQWSLIQALHAQQQFQNLQDSNNRFRLPHHLSAPATCARPSTADATLLAAQTNQSAYAQHLAKMQKQMLKHTESTQASHILPTSPKPPSQNIHSQQNQLNCVSNAGSAFTPVTPRLKKERFPLSPEIPQRSASVPAQRTNEVKNSFPFCWDRKPAEVIVPAKLNRSLEEKPVTETVDVEAFKSKTVKPEMEPSDIVVRPHRVVDLINKADSGSSPCPRDTPDPITGTPTKTNDSEVDSSNDHPNKKYTNTSLPAKKRKLFDQSDSSVPHSPLSISPTMLNKTKADKPSVFDTLAKTSGSGQTECTSTNPMILKNQEDDSLNKTSPQPVLKTDEKSENSKENELQSKEVSSSNIPIISPLIPSKSPSPKPKAVSPQQVSRTTRTLSEEMQPLKKRRLKAVIADALNQNLDESFSSNYSSRNISPINNITSDSDTLPLAIIRDRLSNETTHHISPIKIRAEDHITDIESSLATFQSHVSTPSSMSASSSPVRNNEEPQNNNEISATNSKRRSTNGSTQFTNEELGQLSQFMGLSGSESDDAQRSESESDDEYRSRARVSNSVLGERRKTRSPSSSFSSPTHNRTPAKSGTKCSKKKKDTVKENTVPDKIEDEKFTPDVEKDEILAKFFAAEKAAFGVNKNGTKPLKASAKAKKKVAPKKKAKEAIKTKVKEQKPVSRKRKSGTPRKLEVIDPAQMDTWENSEETEIVKNSANDAEYRIKEHDASWYSVTCFCGQPFAGRPMIECEICGIWVHMTCANVKQKKLPEHYNCTNCRRDSKAVKTRFRQ